MTNTEEIEEFIQSLVGKIYDPIYEYYIEEFAIKHGLELEHKGTNPPGKFANTFNTILSIEYVPDQKLILTTVNKY